MLTFTDEYSRKTWIYLTKYRTDLYKYFGEWQLEVERQSSEKLLAIRCDNAGEYQKLSKRLRRRGVIVEFTTPYTPEHNGVAGRTNKAPTAKGRAMPSRRRRPVRPGGGAADSAGDPH